MFWADEGQPPGPHCVFFYGYVFSWMETSEELVGVVIQGLIMIFPSVWVICMLFTGSPIAATWATLTIALITGSLLGGVKLAFNFALGIGEAIAGCMVGGLAVDYTLHLSHAYMSSTAADRAGKITDAATTMGITVLAGSITTFGSALFMVPCQLTFFSKVCRPPPNAPDSLACAQDDASAPPPSHAPLTSCRNHPQAHVRPLASYRRRCAPSSVGPSASRSSMHSSSLCRRWRCSARGGCRALCPATCDTRLGWMPTAAPPPPLARELSWGGPGVRPCTSNTCSVCGCRTEHCSERRPRDESDRVRACEVCVRMV